MTLKFLFLDFDGTLVDTIDLLYHLYLEFLAQYGKKGSREEFESLNGQASWEVLQTLRERHNLLLSVEELTMRHRLELARAYATRVHFFPGTRDFLERMRRAGLRLIVVTSANRELVQIWSRAQQAAPLFDAIVTPEGLAHAKPHPAIYQRALTTAGASPDEVVVVEDAPHGLAAAMAAGIPTVAFIRPCSFPFALPQGLRGSVRSWEELESLLAVGAPC